MMRHKSVNSLTDSDVTTPNCLKAQHVHSFIIIIYYCIVYHSRVCDW